MKPLYLLISFVVLVGGYAVTAKAESYSADVEGAKVNLNTDKCVLTDQITNLPFVAEWTEKGKTVRGCWKPTPFGMVDLYFEDKTSFSMPMQMFRKVVGV